MSQKINPISVRLNSNRKPDFSWFSDYNYNQIFFNDFNLIAYYDQHYLSGGRRKIKKISQGRQSVSRNKAAHWKEDANIIQSIKQNENFCRLDSLARCIIHYFPKKKIIHSVLIGKKQDICSKSGLESILSRQNVKEFPIFQENSFQSNMTSVCNVEVMRQKQIKDNFNYLLISYIYLNWKKHPLLESRSFSILSNKLSSYGLKSYAKSAGGIISCFTNSTAISQNSIRNSDFYKINNFYTNSAYSHLLSSQNRISLFLNSIICDDPLKSARGIAQLLSEGFESNKSFSFIWRSFWNQISMRPLSNIRGIRVKCSGRINGAEIASCRWKQTGLCSLQRFEEKIDYATSISNTRYGILGIKVWVSYQTPIK